jgi:hypothetical protein
VLLTVRSVFTGPFIELPVFIVVIEVDDADLGALVDTVRVFSDESSNRKLVFGTEKQENMLV